MAGGATRESEPLPPRDARSPCRAEVICNGYAFIGSAPFIFVHQLQGPGHEVGLYLMALVSGQWMACMVSQGAFHLARRAPLDEWVVD
jgi:hypothetical protein